MKNSKLDHCICWLQRNNLGVLFYSLLLHDKNQQYRYVLNLSALVWLSETVTNVLIGVGGKPNYELQMTKITTSTEPNEVYPIMK